MQEFLNYQELSSEQQRHIVETFGLLGGDKHVWICGPARSGKTRFVNEMLRLRANAVEKFCGGFKLRIARNPTTLADVASHHIAVFDDAPLLEFKTPKEENDFYAGLRIDVVVDRVTLRQIALRTPLVVVDASAPPKRLRKFFDVYVFPRTFVEPRDSDHSMQRLMDEAESRRRENERVPGDILC